MSHLSVTRLIGVEGRLLFLLFTYSIIQHLCNSYVQYYVLLESTNARKHEGKLRGYHRLFYTSSEELKCIDSPFCRTTLGAALSQSKLLFRNPCIDIRVACQTPLLI